MGDRSFLLLILLMLVSPGPVGAQLSPGPLATPHEELEGLLNCTMCHELGRPIDGKRCLECHTALQERLDAESGYHALEAVRATTCVSCHGDHHGREYQMIEWEGGRSRFDHRQAGWELAGAHASLDCRACHRPELLDSGWRRQHEASLGDSTWLGLDTNCLSCHTDEHAGQLDTDCLACHTQSAWKPAPGFDHSAGSYPLEAAHRDLECAQCHHRTRERPQAVSKVLVDNPAFPAATRYKDIPANDCIDCHLNPHRAELGQRCDHCHSCDSFASLLVPFDHSLSNYPLEGRHASVACERCHTGQGPGRLFPATATSSCAVCHQDPHAGQFLVNGPPLDCHACHDLQGFHPSLYTLERHRRDRAALEGAHLAAACMDCHAASATGATVPYRVHGTGFPGSGCVDCHQSPHQPGDSPAALQSDCRSCHGLDRWACPEFDHNSTSFELRGAHLRIACVDCHRLDGDHKARPLRLDAGNCFDCHSDPHRRQFVTTDGITMCASCHREDSWRRAEFDHSTSRFPLDGSHKDLSCSECHFPEEDATGLFIRYSPLGISCEDCHNPDEYKTGRAP